MGSANSIIIWGIIWGPVSYFFESKKEGLMKNLEKFFNKNEDDPFNPFAWKLYRLLKSGTGNVVFSPFSIACAVAMLFFGAEGNTRNQIREALGLKNELADDSTALGNYFQTLKGKDPDSNYVLNSANALWMQIGGEILEKYTGILRNDFGAELFQCDFAKDHLKAMREINAWVSGKTREKIPDLLNSESLSPLTRMVIVNALYFLGNWASPFDEELTTKKPFQTPHFPDGEKERFVDMMIQTSDFSYHENSDLQILEMVYLDSPFSMVILLPRRVDGIYDLEENIEAEKLDKQLASFSAREVQVSLPRFNVRSGLDLNDVLIETGIIDAFDERLANFTKINTEEPFFLSQVIHEAVIEVNETGTEAAAATAMVAAMGVMEEFEPEPPAIFKADHPFLYLIRNWQTGSILFSGRLMEP